MADTEFYIVDGEAEEVVEEEQVVIGHSDNLALHLDERELEEIGQQVTQKYGDDKDARQDWEQMFEKGFELLGLKLQETSEPFEGACTAVHPLIIENAVKFQSKASQELFPPKGPVKTQIIGKSTPDKQGQAKRVKEFMNYEISEMMPEYFDEFEECKTDDAIIARDADWLESAFEAKKQLELGYPATEEWIDNTETALKTESAKKLISELRNTKFTDWWQGLKQLN